MMLKRALVAAILVALLGGCAGDTTPERAPAVDEPSGLPTQVVGDARDVADRLDQRYSDMESLVP